MLETYDDEERHVFYHTHQNDVKINNFVIRNKGIIQIVNIQFHFITSNQI